MGHSKSRNEEMRNEKWEMRKWGNGKQTADILLLWSSKGKSMSMYALTERSSLPDSWHQRALHHSLQANSMYKFFTFGSLLAIS